MESQRESTDGAAGDEDTLADREWRLIREESLSGPLCMAYDAVAAETAAAGGPRTVRVYRWSPSTLSLGYRNDPADVDWAFCEREGIDVVRRPTGGGAIYHDEVGDVSYSTIAPASELPGDLMETYDLLCEPLLTACAELGVPAGFAAESYPELYEPACYLRELHPAHDVVYEGRKLSGNAQYRRRDSIIQHGSLTFSARPERTLSCFVDPPVSADTFRERVTGLDEHAALTREECVETLEEALGAWADAEVGTWTDAEHERAAEIAREKFGSEAWTCERVDPLDG
ncbi:lipoate--protein ligase family protein [Halomarina oriensis]|uniref:Lipoate--protein ligase family protein n=1 Tax=Halomarina oriensis TaxID=671145 RepID=A0A6B0GL14_9EURY|nr:biotin/lipoate A/B protein ligase family protein [Halomarina oriensis]MWG35320.1 lipoate--protein ligase family protein [Halomarina oriensis]